MPKSALVVKNLWIFLVVGLVLCLGSCGIIWLFFSISTPTGSTGNKSSSSTKSGLTSSQNLSSGASSAPAFVITRDFKFAGIKDDGTIILFSGQEPEFTIELDDMSWRNLQFSTDNTFVSGLARQTPTSKRDIYIYRISSATWEKITPFGTTDSGVEVHAWENKDNILFIQGNGVQRWLHRYNLSNRQISKLFQVSMQYYALTANELIVVDKIKDTQLVQGLSLQDGKVLWQYSLADLQTPAGVTAKLERIVPMGKEIIFSLFDGKGGYYWLKSGTNGLTLLLNMTATTTSSVTSTLSTSIGSNSSATSSSSSSLSISPLFALQLVCAVEGKLWGWDRSQLGVLSIVETNLSDFKQQPLYTQLVPAESLLDINSVQCTDNKILFKLDRSSSQAAWYLVSPKGGSTISTQSVFTELVTGN